MVAFNLALAFGLELAALTAFGMWGYRLGPNSFWGVTGAIALPVIVAALWGTFLSPKASIALAPALKYSLRLAVFALAALALLATRHPTSAAVFAGLIAFNLIALRLLETDVANL